MAPALCFTPSAGTGLRGSAALAGSSVRARPILRSAAARRVVRRSNTAPRCALEDPATRGASVSSPNAPEPVVLGVPPEAVSYSEPSSQLTAPGDIPEVDTAQLVAKAKAVADDVAARPGYYSSIAGVVGGSVVTLVVASAVVSALDKIPVLPSALELIGLAYTSWFVYRFLLQEETREELKEEVQDFLGKSR